MLVLFSQNDSTWKLADFGFTSEGLFQIAYTSELGRGTEGYRAPEVLGSGVSGKNVATMASDIWALGCIFYELVTKKKAFETSYQVVQYQLKEYDPLVPPPSRYSYQMHDL